MSGWPNVESTRLEQRQREHNLLVNEYMKINKPFWSYEYFLTEYVNWNNFVLRIFGVTAYDAPGSPISPDPY